jgi:hypothetical protein
MILPLRVLLAQLRMRRLELVPDDRVLVGNLNARLDYRQCSGGMAGEP